MVGGRGEQLTAGESKGKSAMKVCDVAVALKFNAGLEFDMTILCLIVLSVAGVFGAHGRAVNSSSVGEESDMIRW